MKKFLTLISLAFFVFVMTACSNSYVEQGTYGENLKWTLDSDGVLLIKGKGQMIDYGSENNIPWNNIKSNIKSVVIKDGIKNIASNAFYKCENLIDVDIADSVESIGDRAFCYCDSLKNINLHNRIVEIGEEAFYACRSLENIDIPDGLLDIKPDTFAVCGFTSIIIPEGVTQIGKDAFSTCSSLVDVYIPKSIKTMNEMAFGSYLTSKIENIYYAGNEEDWNAIEKIRGGGWSIYKLDIFLNNNTNLHYNIQW